MQSFAQDRLLNINFNCSMLYFDPTKLCQDFITFISTNKTSGYPGNPTASRLPATRVTTSAVSDLARLAQARRVDKCLSGSSTYILFLRQSLFIVTLNLSSKSIEPTQILLNIHLTNEKFLGHFFVSLIVKKFLLGTFNCADPLSWTLLFQ